MKNDFSFRHYIVAVAIAHLGNRLARTVKLDAVGVGRVPVATMMRCPAPCVIELHSVNNTARCNIECGNRSTYAIGVEPDVVAEAANGVGRPADRHQRP